MVYTCMFVSGYNARVTITKNLREKRRKTKRRDKKGRKYNAEGTSIQCWRKYPTKRNKYNSVLIKFEACV